MAGRIIKTSLLLLCLSAPAFCEQNYVGRFDAFGGFTYLNSSHVSLGEPGFHSQLGVRILPWLSLGFDHSFSQGDLTLKPEHLVDSTQAALGAQLKALALAGKLPAGYVLTVPTRSRTQTFALGPQVAFRRWQAVTIFVRPSCGYIYENATPKPKDAIATAIVAQLAPSGNKTNWTKFYGFGGGVDLNLTKHFGLRVQADLVRDHLFNDLLKDARNTVRFSIGPAFQWGKNVMQR